MPKSFTHPASSTPTAHHQQSSTTRPLTALGQAGRAARQPTRARQPGSQLSLSDTEEARRWHKTHAELAELLWSPSYPELLQAEAAAHPELAALVELAVTAHASKPYEHRGLGRHPVQPGDEVSGSTSRRVCSRPRRPSRPRRNGSATSASCRCSRPPARCPGS